MMYFIVKNIKRGLLESDDNKGDWLRKDGGDYWGCGEEDKKDGSLSG